MHDVSREDRDRVAGRTRRRASGSEDPRALRDVALVELVVAGGLRTADARLLTLTDLRMDREGCPVAVALADEDRALPADATAALGGWLRARVDVLPVGRILLPDLEPERELRFGARRDVPLARAEAEHVVAAAFAAAGVDAVPDDGPSDLGILARAPAGWCEDCGSRWYSEVMVEGLSTLHGCPRCGGELRMRPERATARRRARVATAAEPQHVLGAPRPPRRGGG